MTHWIGYLAAIGIVCVGASLNAPTAPAEPPPAPVVAAPEPAPVPAMDPSGAPPAAAPSGG